MFILTYCIADGIWFYFSLHCATTAYTSSALCNNQPPLYDLVILGKGGLSIKACTDVLPNVGLNASNVFLTSISYATRGCHSK